MKEAPLTCKLPGQPTIEGYLYTQEKCNGFYMHLNALKNAWAWAVLLITLWRGLCSAPMARPALAVALLWALLHGVSPPASAWGITGNFSCQLSQWWHRAFSGLHEPCKQGANCPALKLDEIYYSFVALERPELWQIAPWLRFIRTNLVSCPASLSQHLRGHLSPAEVLTSNES